jgi:hypothetical protein
MRNVKLLCLLLASASALAATAANATPVLLGIGTYGETVDLSGQSGLLENGLPGNVFGGLGSGFTYAGGNTYLALPDRGPNATPYNPLVDDTTSYIARFQTVQLNIAPSGGGPLPLTVTPTLTGTTLLSSPTPLNYGTGAGLGNKIDGVTPIGSGAPAINTPTANYYTGRSDNFGAGGSGNPNNGRFDPESIRVSPDGKSVFISDEYGPYVKQFDRGTGQLIKNFTLPDNLNVANVSAQGALEMAPNNTSGRVSNKGMEGLAITPDGKTLVGIMQAPLIQDAANAATKNMLRIVTVDVASGTTREYGYNLTTGSGVSEIIAINDHEFLIDERDGKGLGDVPGSVAKVKTLFKIDLSGATDIKKLTGAAAAAAVVGKTKFLDLVALLNANGIASTDIPSKIEGLAFGQDVLVNGVLMHTLDITNDNDFTPDASGPSKIFVVGFSDSDLNVQPEFTPLPPSVALFGSGLLGFWGLWRRRKSSVAA